MLDVLMHAAPLPEELHDRPKKYYTAQGDEPPTGLVRMTEEELREAIARTNGAWVNFLNAQAFEAPSIPDLFLRAPDGKTYRLTVDDDGDLEAELLEPEGDS